MTRRALTSSFTKLYNRYQPTIQAIARKYARADDALWEDLCQVGATTLWSLDLMAARGNLDAYIRQSIRYGIIDEVRRHKRDRTTPLSAVLINGGQLTHDHVTDQPRVIPGPPPSWAEGTHDDEFAPHMRLFHQTKARRS